VKRHARLIVALVALPLLAAGVWYATELLYLREHREINDRRAHFEERTVAFTAASKGVRDARIALRDMAGTMLGHERTVVEHRLRTLLSELATREELTEGVVSHGRPKWETSPAAERGSGVNREFRRMLGDRQDFAVVSARLQGLSTLEHCLRALAAVRAQPWAHRVEGFSLTPKGRERSAYEIKIDLSTMFAPDLVAADAVPPALAEPAPGKVEAVRAVAARDPFRLAEPVVAQAEPPPADPEPEPAAPPPPYDKWRVVGVLEYTRGGAATVEVMLTRTDSDRSRTLVPGDSVLDARLEAAAGETAIFKKEGALLAVRTGETLAQGRPVDSVHSASRP